MNEGIALALRQLLQNQATAFQNCIDVDGVLSGNETEMRKRILETTKLLKAMENPDGK